MSQINFLSGTLSGCQMVLDQDQDRRCANEQHTTVKTWYLCDSVIRMKQNQVSFDEVHVISEKGKNTLFFPTCTSVVFYTSLRVLGKHNKVSIII